jgi:predicted transcriptional regulator
MVTIKRLRFKEPKVSRLTISLNDEIHQALKEAAARQGRSIGFIIEESLQLRGIKPLKNARQLVEQARMQAQLPEADAVHIANEEVRATRKA